MIKITNLTVNFYKKCVLDHISMTLPDKGLVCIHGPSGSGKTTILNCLMGLQKYNGSIVIDGQNIGKLKDTDKDSYRIRNIGYVFQQFNLYENETVENNILIPLKAITETDNFYYDTKIKDTLNIVNLKGYQKKLVKNLSGGEKQRVAISRSIINSPSLLLADEPTGALDYANSLKIMEILQHLSKRMLVIIVSHNINLCKKYCSFFIELLDGKIKNIVSNPTIEHNEASSIIMRKNRTQILLDKKILFHYTKNKIKEHKYRTMFSIILTSFSLLAVGLSFSLSSIINENVVNSYSSLTDENRIVITSEENSESNMISASEEQTAQIKEFYPNDIFDVGICYYADYENIFVDSNKVCVKNNTTLKTISGLSARNINEYKWLDYEDLIVYPKMPSFLNDDEIILGLNLNQIKQICHVFNIKESLESLSSYIENNDLIIYFDFANYDIGYEDQQMLLVKGISLQTTSCFYHYNHKWNEWMLESTMRFPIKYNFKEYSESWRLSKCYYLQLFDEASIFLDKVRYDEHFDKFVFELADSKYFKNFSNYEPENITRLLIFENNTNFIPRYTKYIEDLAPTLNSKIYGTSSGYSIFANYFMSGFSNFTFFSSDEEKLIEYCDLFDEENESQLSSDDILKGHFSNQQNNSVTFSSLNKNLSYLDICISSSMAIKLYGSVENALNQTLYISNQIYKDKSISGSSISHFCIKELNICEVFDDKDYKIYHSSDWLITYFQCYFGISVFKLNIDSISYCMNDDNDYNTYKQKIEKAFPQLTVSNPITDIKETTTSITNYITIILLVFSLLIILISIFLILQTTNLYFGEIKKDIGIARCIGISASQSSNFISVQIGILLFTALLISFIELIVVNLAMSFILNSSFDVVFTPFAYMTMIIFAIALFLLMFLIYKRKINKLSALECLKK